MYQRAPQNLNHARRSAYALLAVVALAGCGGGGGGNDNPVAPGGNNNPPPVSTNNPPSASISSPAAGEVVSALTVVVSGTASDSDGVASVAVNGVAATSTDGFTSWQAEVSMAGGDNTLTVSARDELGNVNSNAATRTVNRRYLFDRASAIISDGRRSRALVIDDDSASIMVIDSANRQSSEFSGATAGQGPELKRPVALLMDTAQDRALIFDAERSALLELDLENGNRQVLASATTGSGPALRDLVLWVLEPSGGYVYALTRATLFKIQLSSGDRETTPLFGATLNSPHTIRFDARLQRVLVSDAQTIYAIDINDGQVTSVLE